ncbi:uncharacterized protein Z518_04321 [Rhinocladiella mackenziei CBS 650.93]|uniref:Transcription factor domain-containing protein n=1 Tax=Rhinocladiella mackenziei CBS 650.93 TaxID=1442369 RepID=A0A0D2JB59_9EURO|nr:uncharacterized protein Z518_04321 [Rhinocladiella mackenziei CBS 650.93]KIX06345.1 hypothetical protein Z518_04321 [Rhinocladiella mackenziei CBS 650.93]
MSTKEPYLGISKSLMYTLVELYFHTSYNASFLLHKTQFLESLAAGTAAPHVILAICAAAANFYRDCNGDPTLKNHGFMIEWANRAGELVFQDVQNFHKDNIVTFSILALFWYTQGSWRLCYLFKGTAALYYKETLAFCSMLEALDLQTFKLKTHWSLKYSAVAYGPLISRSANWADFEDGISRSPPICLESGGSNGGVYAELIKGMTVWASVFSLIKSPESSISERMTGVYALDNDVVRWWSEVPPTLKLDVSNIATIPKDQVSNILLLNLIYHQSICALHASVIPLFSWSIADDSWSSARRSSAQIAFEHACTASTLMDAVYSVHTGIILTNSFIAYAAYSGCAIQIPFMWCLNKNVKSRAIANVRTNVMIIRAMAPYWKFAALLEIHFTCVYKIHERHALTSPLEDEPKNMDIGKFLDFKIRARYARTSILGFVEILRSQGDGFVEAGEECNDLGIQDGDSQNLQQMGQRPSGNSEAAASVVLEQRDEVELPVPLFPPSASSQSRLPDLCSTSASTPLKTSWPPAHENTWQETGRLEEQFPARLPNASAAEEPQSFDLCHPFFDPALLDLFPDGEMPDLGQFETMPATPHDPISEAWDTSGIAPPDT